ncbi:dynein regulatory complex subunit 3-like [Melanaphis sacchari]|uniref:dynein regulatory complex subunit 3-like n=1 Tax=Melanaphis sacchari TaxID=742174 RepID=UPI000DC12FD7|nr:dynein regulatory complex subunit 3-like [Melanaphis sacchari]
MIRSRIITPEIIKKSYLKYECSKDVALILSLEQNFNWGIITELNLSLLSIVHIVGLRLVTNLKCLTLSHNKIKKIENLDCLTKLEELNLSYNRITSIENLDNLIKLNVLSLSGNNISELNNLDNNLQLQAFYINNNEITDINQIFYLKRFKYLQCMDLSNNPATNGNRKLIVDQFPNLIYLDNIHITAEERSLVVEINDEYSLAGSEILGDSNIIHKAFLNETDGIQFFNYLYNEDLDAELLSKWNSTVRRAFATLQKQITDSAMQLYNTSLQKLTVRDEMFSTFKMSHNKFERKLTYESRDIIDEFEEIRRIRIEPIEGQLIDIETNEITNNQNSIRIEKICEHFSIESFVSVTEDEIIVLKRKLHEKNIYMNKTIMDMISKYTKFVEEELKLFLELLVPIFFNMRAIISTYTEILSENVRLAVNNPIKIIPKEFINHFENRFVINDAVVKMSDRHMEMIYKREELLNTNAKKWAEKSIEDLKNSEKQRFWMVFEEITRYSDKVSIWLKSLKNN